MSKESFKAFARTHPDLAKVVLEGNASWQQLYELYEIYGDSSTVWNSFFTTTVTDNIASSANTLKDFITTFKNIDMDSVQKGITNISKTINLLQDIGFSSPKKEVRPIYQRFDD